MNSNNSQEQLSAQFGRYNIEKELGRGGMGVVYKAYDTKFKRTVALKVMLRIKTSDTKRLMHESFAMAQLNHPHIIRLYEFEEKPTPHLTMEYIKGVSLDFLIAQKQIKPLFLINLLIKVCDALAHAHKNKILHRDIKPSNIMITKDGNPKVMDFGLAKIINEQELSKTGDVLGTLGYMAPEQLNGKATEKSDIYALGATMYKALTNRSIYSGNSYQSILFQILKKEIIPPRHLNPDISVYLEAVCLKCLAKKERRRYESFRALALELKNLKHQRPILARKYSVWDSVGHFINEHRVICGSLAIALISLISCLVIAVFALKTVKEQQQKTNVARKEAEKNWKSLQKSNLEIKSLNSAMIEFVKNIKQSSYHSVLATEEIVKPLVVVFSQSVYLKTAEEYKFLRGLILGQSKEVEHLYQAILDYTKEIQKNSNSDIYTNRGIVYFRLKKYKEALSDYNKAIEINDYNSRAYNSRGRIHALQKQYGKAIKDYDKSILRNPKNLKALNNRAFLYKEMKEYKKSLIDYNKIIDLSPKLYYAYQNRSQVYKEQGKYKLALKDCDIAIKLKPDNAFAYNNKGENLFYLQKYKEALHHYDKSIFLNSQNSYAYKNRGDLHYHKERYKLAIKDWKSAIFLNHPQEKLLKEKIIKLKSNKH
ncbi:protein kinase [Candidatus Uabimicrobium sp. HlEnr_7]|uniref:protein kinase domain-containing protein n=1 Tax=Candidatus Uabimicrobium helgolandensis TaxID=3095367 RepID=UPI0035564175